MRLEVEEIQKKVMSHEENLELLRRPASMAANEWLTDLPAAQAKPRRNKLV